MKYILFEIIAAVLLGLFITGCSELQDDIAQPGEVMIHKEGISDPHSENFHGILVKENHWNLKACAQCHGQDFSGGIVDVSCRNCHVTPEGPASCNTCHGQFTNPSRIAPPTDLSGNFSPEIKTVGAHTSHIYENVIGRSVFCDNCHQFPESLYAPGHLDGDNISEVNLKNLAVAFGADDALYDAESAKCSNTYCHGNFEFYKDSALTVNQFAYTSDKMVGENKTVDWTKAGQNEAKCGSCHGIPPEGHIAAPLDACYQCHPGVVDPTGKILDKTKHINGEKNVRE